MTSLVKNDYSNLKALSNEELEQTDGGGFLAAAGIIIAGATLVGIGYTAGKWVGDKVFN